MPYILKIIHISMSVSYHYQSCIRFNIWYNNSNFTIVHFSMYNVWNSEDAVMNHDASNTTNIVTQCIISLIQGKGKRLLIMTILKPSYTSLEKNMQKRNVGFCLCHRFLWRKFSGFHNNQKKVLNQDFRMWGVLWWGKQTNQWENKPWFTFKQCCIWHKIENCTVHIRKLEQLVHFLPNSQS